MERVIQVHDSWAAAEAADRAWYARLTPRERLMIQLELIRRYQESLPDAERGFKRVNESLNSTGVEFLVAGGHAVGFHGHPRFTGDIDIVVRPVAENAARLLESIRRFGFDNLVLDISDFTATGRVIQLGHPPNRIDLLTSLSGVTWEEADATAVTADLDGVRVRFLGRRELIRNKRATGRAQDLADLEALGEP